MNYLIYIGIILFVLSGFALLYATRRIISIRNEYKGLKKAKDELNEEVESQREFLRELYKKNGEMVSSIAVLTNEREVAKTRAAEAQAATNQVLQSEQGRLAAELERTKERMQQQLKQEQDQLDLFYLQKQQKLEEDYTKKKDEFDTELKQKKGELDEFRAISDSVNAAILRQKELEEKEEFYSIQITDNEKEDIKVLQQMDLKLHNRDAIPNLIWTLYIRRPAQEMIKRVIGGKDISGIYKITYKPTKEAYIGKSTSIQTRWQNHIKTAIGLEAAAKSTLHTRMAKDGIWDYTFEIIEEVPKDQLSAREAFYIDLYGTKKQLNMKEGSSK